MGKMKTGDYSRCIPYDLIRFSFNFQALMIFRLHIIESLMSIEILCSASSVCSSGQIFNSSPSSKAYSDQFIKRRTDYSVCPRAERIIYNGGREPERQSDTRSSMTAVPAQMTVSAPPQYIFTVPSSSGTAPQVKTTLGT